MEKVWRKLPLDLLEEVVTFLPLASLCRFRAVSKKWNRFINHPSFALRHAQASSPEEYILICEQDVHSLHCQPFPHVSWQVMDVTSKRFFHLSNDFLAKFIQQEGIFDHCLQASSWRSILAANGGLLCLSYYVYHNNKSFSELRTHEVLLVCNPVLKTVKQLPHFAGWLERPRPEWIVMSIDRDSMEYEIFFIALATDALQPNVAYIYESKTSSWRASIVVLEHCKALSRRYLSSYGFVILKDEFYAFFDHDHGLLARLVSYNKVTSVVSDLGIDVPCSNTINHRVSLKLVVSDGRLFCVITHTSRMDRIMQVSSIEIVELIIAKREYVHLSRLQGDMLDSFLGNRIHNHFIFYECHAPTIVTGLANSIFFCSYVGQSLAYNLLEKTWHKFPDRCCNSFLYSRQYHSVLSGSNYSLSLCAP